MSGLLAWLREHRNVAAAAVAAFVVWRVVRFGATWVWTIAGWDDITGVGEWAFEHWLLAVALLCGLFAVVFLAVRAVIPWLQRRFARGG